MEIILGHPITDFDALAAQQAAARLYAGAIPVLARQLNENVAEFVGLYRDELLFADADKLPDEPVSRVILVDTRRIWGNWRLADATPVVVIDHHAGPETPAPHPATLISEPCGATTTILAGRLLEAGAPISPAEATLFLLGIYEDTGNLTFDGTTAADVRCAAALLERGADLGAVRRYGQRALSTEQEEAYRALLPSVASRELGGWPVLTGWAELGHHVGGLAALAGRLRDAYAPAALVLAFGVGGGTQLIARAEPGALDAGALMERFGGGGHPGAAAAFVREWPAAALAAEIDALLPGLIKPALTAGALMSQPLRSIRDTATVREAAELLRRWDYAALPVVDAAGRLCGDIGRRELQKAERHGLSDAPIRRYWWRSPATAAPGLPVAELRRLLAGEERGRAYVVAGDGKPLGVVTRGDLLHHTERAAGGRQPGADERDRRLAASFDALLRPDQAAHVALAGEIAARHGWGLYAVGGFVRDMLLGRRPGDLDLVIEGDAVAVARELAQATGGALRSHEAFHTATVEWPDAPDLPHLDFITARAEFYEHPSALPEVEAASLRHDLHRRDFTINTLALALTPARRGHLYDFYGGLRDLERKLIRVLHNLSFIDDPTRLLRAVRLAARLGFAIEPRTGELIGDAIAQGLIHRTTPARIRHELRLLLEEPTAPAALALLGQTGLLAALHPALRFDSPLAARVESALALELAAERRRDLLLLLLLGPLPADERAGLAERFLLPQRVRQLVAQRNALDGLEPELRTLALSDGRLDRLLAPFDELALRAAALDAGGLAAERIAAYLRDLRPIAALLNGNDLRAAGLPPGPRYAELLAGARAAQLDERWAGREEALRWLDGVVGN